MIRGMTSAVQNGLAPMIAPNRRWNGPSALIPVATCHRILDVLLWFVLMIGVVALGLAYVRAPELMRSNPLYWLLVALQVPLFVAAAFRALPFQLRYAALIVPLFSFAACTSAELGLTPNWSYEVMILVVTTSLFFGAQRGMMMVGAVALVHVLIAWGWVAGALPVYLAPSAPNAVLDFRSATVWIRTLVVAVLSLASVVMLMRYVLADLNRALRSANDTLQKLAVEQEYRARAEEARLKAEVAAREAQKFDALGRLASGVAHDFNNALCVIKCWSSFLGEEKRDPQLTDALADIRRATENAEHLTHHLLAFSKGDPSRREVVDLAEVARLEGKTLTRLLPNNIQVSVEAASSLLVRLGRGQLQEILLNLAINARDAMTSGGRLTIRVSPLAVTDSETLMPGKYVCLEVADTGEGMDAATQARIFEPFFTTKHSTKGTGLGLAMVFGLVTGAGGDISVESQVGRGSCFRIRLPAASAEEMKAKPRVTTITAPTRCRVLIVDHQPEIRSLIERILAREGFPVITAANGQDAVSALGVEGNRFGLLIVSGMLPDRRADEVIARALAVEATCRVIILADHRQDETLHQGIENGQYQLLPKPFDSGQLREAVNLVLRGATADAIG